MKEIPLEARSQPAGVRQNLLQEYLGLDSFTVIIVTAAAVVFVVMIRFALRRSEDRPSNDKNSF